jgi:transposase
VFLDESGMLMAPLVRRTWALCGQPPVLQQRGAHHRKVSAVAVLCVPPTRQGVRLYFRLYPEADIRAPQIIAFLRHLDRALRAPWLLLWDRLNAHRARRTRDFLLTQGRLHTCFFPSYAPELNPVEYVWCYLKTNPLANSAYFDLPSLADSTRHHTRHLQHCPDLLRSFVQHSPLFLRLR